MKSLKRKHLFWQVLTLGLFGAAFMLNASAGTTGAEFKPLFDLFFGWATGYLGKAVAIAGLLVGGVMGFARGTAMPAMLGLVFAIIYLIFPGVIGGMLTATI